MDDDRGGRSVRIAAALIQLTIVVGVIALAVLVVDTAVGMAHHGDRPIASNQLDITASVPSSDVHLRGPFVAVDPVRVRTTIAHPTGDQLASSAGLQLAPGVLFLIGLLFLHGIVWSVRQGSPFDPRNVRRLRSIGFVVLFGVPVVNLIDHALATHLTNSINSGYWDAFAPGLALNWPGWSIFGGLGAFVLAEVFAHGIRLREDVEATI
jgi:hypothetical protein